MNNLTKIVIELVFVILVVVVCAGAYYAEVRRRKRVDEIYRLYWDEVAEFDRQDAARRKS